LQAEKQDVNILNSKTDIICTLETSSDLILEINMRQQAYESTSSTLNEILTIIMQICDPGNQCF
jgi:hypothetical protein